MTTHYEALNKELNNEMQQLAEQIKSGNYTERHRNRLATIIYPKLKYFIWKFFNDPEETEEALANTLEKIFKGLGSYSGDYRFTTWIYTIARNEALLHQHNLKVKRVASLDTLLSPPNIKDESQFNLAKEEYLTTLYSMTHTEMMEMPDSIEKSILIDKELNRMKGAELAEKYSMNLNTVKTKIRKARRILKETVLSNNPEMIENLKDYI